VRGFAILQPTRSFVRLLARPVQWTARIAC